MPLAPLVALLVALATVRAGITDDVVEGTFEASKRSIKSLGPPTLPPGCLYEGRWFTDGATVPTGEACLHCACYHGALTCRRRACAPLPDPPPHRCHVLHRRGACCPELHCPDGIILMEQGASARLESEDVIAAPASIAHACVEGGTIYAAGSAMRSSVACEQCFCLGGARRCVRPRCLPPPSGCRSRPAAGACCPQRYYCEHPVKPPEEKHPHDCKVDNKWVTEGERVMSSKNEGNCSQCFCLRGSVQCQPLSCAPPLLGCKPMLRPGECCAHQYYCEHKHHGSNMLTLSSNALTSTRSDDRAFHASKSNKHETTTKNTLANIYTVKNTPTLTATKNNLVSTTKVKRKTSDPPPEISSEASVQSTTIIAVTTTTTQKPTTLAKLIATTITKESISTSTEFTTEATSTEQPEGSIKIMINGTINCTAELSSTSLPLNMTFNDTKKIQLEAHPRVPLIDVSSLEDHTFSANDIITDRTINGGFDENESFVINVTSSLVANTTHTSMKPPIHTSTVSKVSLPTDIVETLNSSKKTKGDYDYDYPEPTLPPSLPNLKIIPFLAADAVVENEHPKKILTYPILEREDKFPIYYPSADSKESTFVTRREDQYRPTQYPVFITDKPDHEHYPALTPEVDLTNIGYLDVHTVLDNSVNKFTSSESFGNPDSNKPVTEQPFTTTTFKLETPIINLFSPPIETEGGFVPKGPTGLIDEYFAVFPSTPSGPAVPHLTTSMQLDIAKEECVSGDGRHIPEGDTITLACSECTCAWGDLHCSPRPCHTPAGCRRRPATSSSGDLCCGELICDKDDKTTIKPEVTTTKINVIVTQATELKNITDDVVKFDSVVNNQATITNNTVQIDTPIKKEETTLQSQSSPQDYDKTETTKELTTTSTTTQRLTTKLITTTSTAPIYKATTESNNTSLEYEEDEDEGFSFGSVLKLLLSENYDATTTVPKRLASTTKVPPKVKLTTTTRRPRPTLPLIQPPKPSIAPFVPLPVHPYIPPKKNQNSINRIDHLVLGEATAIKRTTSHPITTTLRSLTTNRPDGKPTPQHAVTKSTETTKEDTYTTHEAPRLSAGLTGLGSGLLKLAGCNIYGRMYRVGRIITELSTPCQECWCTEFGVQCKQLNC